MPGFLAFALQCLSQRGLIMSNCSWLFVDPESFPLLSHGCWSTYLLVHIFGWSFTLLAGFVLITINNATLASSLPVSISVIPSKNIVGINVPLDSSPGSPCFVSAARFPFFTFEYAYWRSSNDACLAKLLCQTLITNSLPVLLAAEVGPLFILTFKFVLSGFFMFVNECCAAEDPNTSVIRHSTKKCFHRRS